MNICNKKNIVFVGAFKEKAGDGAVGGQLYACKTLIESEISGYINWITIDSTMESLPPPPIWRRLFLALKRGYLFLTIIPKKEIDGTLIFASAGFSFFEKGLMALWAHCCRKWVVFAPRSGKIHLTIRKSRFMKWYIPFVLCRCNMILCQSHSWYVFYKSISNLSDNHFVVIKNWINCTSYLKLNITEKKENCNVLFLGWIECNKGIYDLVNAVSKRQNEMQNIQFIICGKGDQFNIVQQYIEELGLSCFFDFRGWVSGDEKEAILQKTDIFVLPSHVEGMPNSLIEAMAAGKAVISTRVGGIPELVIDENMGRLIEPGDVSALGQAIIELSQQPELRNKIGKKAQKHIFLHHDINHVWSKILDALSSKET